MIQKHVKYFSLSVNIIHASVETWPYLVNNALIYWIVIMSGTKSVVIEGPR